MLNDMYQILAAIHQSPWTSIAGILINTLGVCVLAFEWRISMYDSLNRLEIEQADLISASGKVPRYNGYTDLSPKAQWIFSKIDSEVLDAETVSNQIKNALIIDSVERLNRRMKTFLPGFIAVIMGAALQVFAALPSHIFV